MNVVVLMGVSGAGKNYFIDNNMPEANMIVSADTFFMKDGKYVFDAAKLGDAHSACFRKFIENVRLTADYASDGSVKNTTPGTLVVNNTNSSISEIAPYMAAAKAYGADASIICLRIDPVIAASRATHGAPLETIVKMAAKIDQTLKELSPWWAREVLQWNPETSSYREWAR